MQQFYVTYQLTIYLLYHHSLDRKLGAFIIIPNMVTGAGMQAPLVEIKPSFSPFTYSHFTEMIWFIKAGLFNAICCLKEVFVIQVIFGA
jgi:hypothetical protein